MKNSLNTSNHIDKNFQSDGEDLEIEIFTTSINTTAYQIKNTQGAEYGEEAERIRKVLNASFDMLSIFKELQGIEAFISDSELKKQVSKKINYAISLCE